MLIVGTSRELSAKEEFLCNEAKHKLFIDHEKKRAAIKVEAMNIGL